MCVTGCGVCSAMCLVWCVACVCDGDMVCVFEFSRGTINPRLPPPNVTGLSEFFL